MKNVLFVLLLSLIGFGAKTYSQTTVSLDSVIEKYSLEFLDYCQLKVSLSINSLDSIDEKGVFIINANHLSTIILYSQNTSVDSISHNESNDSIEIPIYNNDFDTLLYFVKTGGTIIFKGYYKKDGELYFSNDSIIQGLPIEGGLDKVLDERNNISIYPTLFDNEVNIKSEVMDYSVGLYDIYGRSIFYKKTQKENLQINTSDLSKGIYLILIKDKTNNPIKVQKLIKN